MKIGGYTFIISINQCKGELELSGIPNLKKQPKQIFALIFKLARI